MRRPDASHPMAVARRIVVAVTLLAVAGCGSRHHLEQYQFADRTLGLVYLEPPAPKLLHGYYNIGVSRDAVRSVVNAGATVAKEVAATRASARLDSATRRVDVSKLLAQRTVDRASRYLGTRPAATPDIADYVLEVTMRGFGIDARDNAATYLYTHAEAVLLERRTGREIWSVDVRGSDRLTPFVQGNANIPGAIINAGTLSTVSVANFQQALEQLVTLTSNVVTAELREKLRDARDR